MCLLLESIYLNDGVFRNLDYHEARMKYATRDLFHKETSFDLLTVLGTVEFPLQGLFKTRVIYDSEIRKIEFVPYTIKPVRSLKLIHDSSVIYNHKFLDRSTLDRLFAQRGTTDDILIIRNGLITDTYYANVIFQKNGKWFTPDSYLLNGTMRQSLLDVGMIGEARIGISDLTQFQSAKLINSMLAMDGPEISIQSIY